MNDPGHPLREILTDLRSLLANAVETLFGQRSRLVDATKEYKLGIAHTGRSGIRRHTRVAFVPVTLSISRYTHASHDTSENLLGVGITRLIFPHVTTFQSVPRDKSNPGLRILDTPRITDIMNRKFIYRSELHLPDEGPKHAILENNI